MGKLYMLELVSKSYMWQCQICGFSGNRNTDVLCLRTNMHPMIRRVEKCRERCSDGQVQDRRDIYGMTWIRCPMLGRPNCRYS